MDEKLPELNQDDWKDIHFDADNTHLNSFANGAITRSIEKAVMGVARAGLRVTDLGGSIFSVKKSIDILNKNIEDFNKKSSKLTIIGLILTGLMALAAILNAVAILTK